MSGQLDISDDGFLSLMNDDGDTKDDVRMPDGEIGEKINKLFKVDEKDTSESTWQFFFSRTRPPRLTMCRRRCCPHLHG